MTAVTGIDFETGLLKNLDKAPVLSFGSGTEVLSGSQGYKFIAFGTNFADFDAKGFAHSGTVTQFEVVKGDFVVMDWTRLSTPVADFWSAMKTGNVDTVGALVFAGDDKFDIVGSINGAPAPTYNGYGGNDIFHLNLSLHGAAVNLNGGAGDDTFNLDKNFDAATDRIDGGTGYDTVNLSGGSAADLTFTANSMVNVERIVLAFGSAYTMTMNDNTVAADANLLVDASAINRVLSFDGHAESNGSYTVIGGSDNDFIIGGRGADTLNGGTGADTLTGGQGADHFIFNLGFGHDIVTDFAAAGSAHDVIQLDAAAFGDFQSLMGHMAMVGADTVITLDANDSIVLQHVNLASLSAGDFLFV